ncbi:6-phosphofructokinase [Candidatus Woesearchaeota archaeon]|nr:6-phosphofructokinase [Candidatus Woesearchaeota archaeon]
MAFQQHALQKFLESMWKIIAELKRKINKSDVISDSWGSIMKTLGILTGGGDTSALNAFLYSAVEEAAKKGYQLIGFLEGWKGVKNRNYKHLSPGMIDPYVGGTFIKTERERLKKNDGSLEKGAKNISELVDCFIAIGGEDTLSIAKDMMQGSLLKIPFVMASKTIDNDVGGNAPDGNVVDYESIFNYYTNGFATAACRSAEFSAALRTTSHAHSRIMVVECMGRTAGWLALASGCNILLENKLKEFPQPDFIIIPEFPLDYADLKEKIKEKYNKPIKSDKNLAYLNEKNIVIVISEGAKHIGSEKPISEDESNIDGFGHKKLGGVAEIIAKRLKEDLKLEVETGNFNDEKPNYIYRSGLPTETDVKNAIEIGKACVKLIDNGATNKFVALQRKDSKFAAEAFDLRTILDDGLLKLDGMGKIVPRTADKRFYDPKTYSITEAGLEYFRPILNTC